MAETQHGLLARRQALAIGFSEKAIRYRLQVGRWSEVKAHVYAIGGVPPSPRQRLLAATLSAGPRPLVSHRSALCLWGSEHERGGRTEILVPRPSRPRAVRAVVRSTTTLLETERHVVDGIPVTSPTRTLLDVSAPLHPVRLEHAVDDFLRRRLCTLDGLAARFHEVDHVGRRRRSLVRKVIAQRTAEGRPTGSEFERSVLALLARRGIRPPVLQHPVDLPSGRVHLDLSWPDVRHCLECDGVRWHGGLRRVRYDDARHNELIAAGWGVQHVTWSQYVTDREWIADVVEEALARLDDPPR